MREVGVDANVCDLLGMEKGRRMEMEGMEWRMDGWMEREVDDDQATPWYK